MPFLLTGDLGQYVLQILKLLLCRKIGAIEVDCEGYAMFGNLFKERSHTMFQLIISLFGVQRNYSEKIDLSSIAGLHLALQRYLSRAR